MHRRNARGDAPASDARGTLLIARRCRVLPRVFFSLTRVDADQTQADLHQTRLISANSGRIGSYWLNIGVFRPKKGNQPVRKKKEKNLKLKILVDLIHCCRRLHRLNPFLLLLLLFCFFVFLFLFFSQRCHSVLLSI